jgi:hypothetical protein
MPKITPLDKQWEELMFLCRREADFLKDRSHPKVLKLVSRHIDELAAQMGFSRRQTQTREFRSERSGGHIVRIVKD